jgi:putative NADH-flavin reductase
MKPPDRPVRLCIAGATGATGSRVARLAVQSGAEVIIAGRNETRLHELADELGGAETRQLDLADRTAIERILAEVDVVANCCGPFTHIGMPVARAAVRTGTPYVDTCGEPRFCLDLVEEARHARAPVVTAVGVSSMLADLATAVAVGNVGNHEHHEITLAYQISGYRPTGGSLRSAVEILAGGSPVVCDRRLRMALPGSASRQFSRGRGVLFAVPDAVVVSRYCHARTVEAFMVVPAGHLVGAVVRGGARVCSRPRLRAGLSKALARAPGLDDGHPHGRVTLTASVGGHHVSANATDVYGFTAAAVVYVAAAAAHSTLSGGLHAASELFSDPKRAAEELGVRLDFSAPDPKGHP